MKIRKAVKNDISAILDIENSCFTSDGFSRRQFLYLMNHAKGSLLVATTEEDKIVGYLSLLVTKRLHSLRIYSIAVSPNSRGSHLGQSLMDYAINYAKTNKLIRITLEVSIKNTVAIQLYQKNGFETFSIKKEYYHDGSDAYYMKKILN